MSENDCWPGQLIHQATLFNNVELLQCVLQGDERAYINSKDICGRTPVYTAVSNDALQCLHILLDHGADMNLQAGPRCHNMTPLHEAVMNRRMDALALLVSRGADLSLIDESGQTPLALAKCLNHQDVVEVIEMEQEKKKGLLEQLSVELCEACAKGSTEEVEKLLEKTGPYKKRVINMDTKGLSPLGITAKCGHLDILNLLLSQGAACTSQKDTGLTLLHLACESGNNDIVTVLLQTFPELIYVRSVDHQTPLHSAVASNKVETVRLLLSHTYPSISQSFQEHHFDSSSESGHGKPASLLEDGLLEVNARDASGDTPLHIACKNGYYEIAQLLLYFKVKIPLTGRESNLRLPHTSSFSSRSALLEMTPKSEEDRYYCSDALFEDDTTDGLEEKSEDGFADISPELDKENGPSSDSDISPACPFPTLPLHGERTRKYFCYLFPVKVNLPNSNGFSAFHTAISYKQPNILQQILCARSPLPNKIQLKTGEESVLMFAYAYRNVQVLQLLLFHGHQDVESRLLSSAFLSRDREVQCLLLTHKSSRDMSHNINKTEMRRLSTLLAQQPSRGTDPVELSQPDTVEEQQIVPLKDNAGFPVDNDKGPPTERFKVSGKEKGASGQTQGDGSKLRPSDFFAKTSFRSRGSSHDPDYKRRFPTVAVAMVWDNIGMLNTLETSCLEEACRLHNPMMSLDLHRAVYLCAITKVDISKNSFEQLPPVLLGLPSLVILKASRNLISSISEDLAVSVNLPALEELHLNENKLTHIPRFLFHLPMLKYLDLSVNRLTELPVEMWETPALVTLRLSSNALSCLPTSVSSPAGGQGSGSSQHVSRWQQQQKESRQRRRSSSSSFQSQSRLFCSSSTGAVSGYDTGCDTPIYIVGANADDPVDFLLLSPQEVTTNPLVRVNKWGTGVTVVDRDPWKGVGMPSSGLKQLWLNRNRFKSIPPCLPCCAPNLEILVMSENPLTSVGLISDYPAGLLELDLSRTGLVSTDQWKLVTDPAEVVCYAPVASLQSAKCSVISLDGSFSSPGTNRVQKRSSSTSAAGFDMGGRGNSSTSSSPGPRDMMSYSPPCPHRGHSSLVRLEKLHLSFNYLTSIALSKAKDSSKDSRSLDTNSICSMESEEIQGRLLFPNISELDLSCNKLTSLSPDIGEHVSLKILTLRGNTKLKELPPKLGLLKSLWKLELELCPLDGAIQDFILNSRYPVKDILGFLQSVLEESTVYNSMNLMFVGFHSIGKTSLLQKLCERGRTLQKSTHWRDRVNKEVGKKQTTLLSTVGIDINELLLEKRTKGPVVFRTWDFGGQKEYYATHQYFLSPRSLYLVVWSIIDGERGVESLLQWLINIQARAPGAPVIIVGTHLDILKDKATRRNFPEDFEESMMLLIQKMFLSNPEPDKSGLPNILAAVNVSCKTGENIRILVDMIYENSFELKHPRSRTQHLIGQKIPRKYLLLQSIIRELAFERLKLDKEPVLNRSKYTLCVQNKMMEHGVTFRDVEELEQATRFLHENGVLFHYDDLPLKDLFFLDPQWLCDQLAKVITVKEINNFAQRGVMRLKSLEFLFKSARSQIGDYITNLLNKFEVALQFDKEYLLLPSLLPTETELLEMARRKSDVRIPLRKPSESSVGLGVDDQSSGHVTLRSKRSGRTLAEGLPKIYQEPVSLSSLRDSSLLTLLAVNPTSNPIFSLCRLYFMTYFPSGFWSRLITRVLADGSFYNIVRDLFHLPVDLLHRSPEVKVLAERGPEWRCWQTGFELFYLGFEVMRIREVFFSTSSYFCDYSQCRIKCSIDNEWSFLDVLNSKILEITFPTDSLKFHVASKDGPQLQNLDESKPSSIVYREEVATTKLLVKIVEHVDNLLQDWYPDLGEQRFSQNCEGRYLVTRVVPCPQCLHQEMIRQKRSQNDVNPWFFLNPDVPDMCMPVVVSDKARASSGDVSSASMNGTGLRGRSQTMPNGALDPQDGGSEAVDNLPVTRPRTLTEGQTFIYNIDNPDSESVVFTWLVERCMLDVLEGVDSVCPMHGSVSPLYLLGSREGLTRQQFVTPDVAFQDQFQDLLLPTSSHLDIGPCVGKGNFGEVHEGLLLRKESHQSQHVAVKILFKQAQARSDLKRGFQGSMEHACSAYLTARQEVSILTRLQHEHIVPLVGLCLRPLALLLDLAPKGDLSSRLEELHSQGELLPLFVIKQVAMQVANALAYLHSENIIYRDLKSENVLIWELPDTADAHPLSHVDVKLADYGISRTVLPTGARGFGGTPPYIAPEILQHAGKGTYSAKVDVYSFGMFMFEILTCRAPFANVSNINNLICQGERPSLTVQEAERCPSYMLDLMSLCWSHCPDDRPSMDGVLGICSSTQFCHLQDVMTLGPDVQIYCGCPVYTPSSLINDMSSCSDNISLAGGATSFQQSSMPQIWLSSGFHGNNGLEIFTFNHARRVDTYRTISLLGPPILAICVYDSLVWCLNSEGLIQIFQSESLSVVHQIQLPLASSNSANGTSQRSTLLGLYPCPLHQCVLSVGSEGTVYTVEEPLGGLLTGEAIVRSASLMFLPNNGKTKEQETEKAEEDSEVKKSIKCYCSTLVITENSCELWVGQGMGQIAVWDVSNCLISYLSHGNKITSSSASCAFIITQADASGLSRYVWSYNYPGSIICQWDATTKMITRRLDCSQIVSTVTTPVLDVSERFDYGLQTKEGKGGQVSTLSAIQRFLYVGTTRGCLLVTDAVSLSPLCVFQCHAAQDFYLKLVLPVTQVEKGRGQGGELGAVAEEALVDDQEEEEEAGSDGTSKLAMPAVVSIGKGYCNTLKVFHPGLDSINTGMDDETTAQVDPFANHTFMLTWNAADWDLY
ncbi:hypothetical protein RRG08_011777 [Elysia crispata]|uniref:non-specific serine/threonine protein kinase n=1 Tax=Elysia crispata TaxID=231223 RepID=A0AAE0ZK28_9GAST|nr:hypothetical protein RRG08_011777 [Elysia crispata]